MQITITLNSLEELEELQTRILVGGPGTKLYDAPAKQEEPKKPAPKKETVKPAEPAAEKAAEETEKTGEAKDGTDMDESTVKVMLADKIKSGKKAEIRALFEEYGVAKLSELISKYPDKLQEFAKKAEAL